MYTRTTSGYDFVCTPGVLVEAEVQSRIDLYNSMVEELLVTPRVDLDAPLTPELVLQCVKLASWLMFSFMHTHPYLDGNGRMGHLLANSVFTPFCPVPVYISPASGTPQSWRRVYLDAIVSCRTAMPVGEFLPRPTDLATILLDSLWGAWRSVWTFLRAWHIPSEPTGSVYIGCAVMTVAGLAEPGVLEKKLALLAHSLRLGGCALPTDNATVRRFLQAAALADEGGGVVMIPAPLHVSLEDGAVVEVVLLPSHVSMSRAKDRVSSRVRRDAPDSPHASSEP